MLSNCSDCCFVKFNLFYNYNFLSEPFYFRKSYSHCMIFNLYMLNSGYVTSSSSSFSFYLWWTWWYYEIEILRLFSILISTAPRADTIVRSLIDLSFCKRRAKPFVFAKQLALPKFRGHSHYSRILLLCASNSRIESVLQKP